MTASSVSNENRLYHKKQLVWVLCEMIQERQKRTAIKVSGNRQEERLCVTGSLTKSPDGGKSHFGSPVRGTSITEAEATLSTSVGAQQDCSLLHQSGSRQFELDTGLAYPTIVR